MEARFVHVNMDIVNGIDTIWSPEIDHSLPEGNIELSAMPMSTGKQRTTWSPEHLFAAGVSGSIATTFFSLARHEHLEIIDFSIKASGKIEKTKGKQKLAELILVPTVGLADDSDFDTCSRLLERARRECPICDFVPIKILVRPYIEVSAAMV